MRRLIATVALLVIAASARADELRPLPPLLHTVSDEVGALSDYAERLAQRWKRERDLVPERSVLAVLAVTDREFQVMPGKGLESIDRELKKPEAYANLVPLFRQGRYFDVLLTVNRCLLQACA